MEANKKTFPLTLWKLYIQSQTLSASSKHQTSYFHSQPVNTKVEKSSNDVRYKNAKYAKLELPLEIEKTEFESVKNKLNTK